MNLSEKTTLVKDFVTILAIVGGGLWAVYVSYIKNEIQMADLQMIELQQKTEERAHLVSKMDIQTLDESNGATVVSISIKLENSGNKDVRVVLDERSIMISKIEFEEGETNYKNPNYIGGSRYSGFDKIVGPYVDVGPNESYEISYVSKIECSGIYLIRFLTNMDSLSESDSGSTDDFSIYKYSTGVDKVVKVD